MAITTLPYPNMDFVPLDVLTADELDQIVANIDAINNASIPTDSIADGAVTSDKIDWTTLSQSLPTSGAVPRSGFFQIGNLLIQYGYAQRTGLNTAQYGYNAWTVTMPTSFSSANYAVIVCQTTDTGNVAGGEFKVSGNLSVNSFPVNYNHVNAIGSGTLNYAWIAIGYNA